MKEESSHPFCIIVLISLYTINRRCGFKSFLDLEGNQLHSSVILELLLPMPGRDGPLSVHL